MLVETLYCSCKVFWNSSTCEERLIMFFGRSGKKVMEATRCRSREFERHLSANLILG
jgi:hypothetical protein